MDCVLSIAICCCFGYCPKQPRTIKEYQEQRKNCKESLSQKQSHYRQVLHQLSHQQIQELLKENFGEENSRYHTLDELPLYKLEAKLNSKNPITENP